MSSANIRLWKRNAKLLTSPHLILLISVQKVCQDSEEGFAAGFQLLKSVSRIVHHGRGHGRQVRADQSSCQDHGRSSPHRGSEGRGRGFQQDHLQEVRGHETDGTQLEALDVTARVQVAVKEVAGEGEVDAKVQTL